MSEEEALVAVVAMALSAFVVVKVARYWFESRVGRGHKLPALTDERLTRIEHAVEAVAVEVERISEGQRFATKLLAEREPVARRAPE